MKTKFKCIELEGRWFQEKIDYMKERAEEFIHPFYWRFIMVLTVKDGMYAFIPFDIETVFGDKETYKEIRKFTDISIISLELKNEMFLPLFQPEELTVYIKCQCGEPEGDNFKIISRGQWYKWYCNKCQWTSESAEMKIFLSQSAKPYGKFNKYF